MRSHAGRHLLAVLAMLLGIGLWAGAMHMRPDRAGYVPDFSAIPMELAGLEGQRMESDEDLKRYLEADVVETLTYGTGSDQILVNIIYGVSWRTVHSPAQCYPAAGWAVVAEKEVIIPVDPGFPHEDAVMGTLMQVERDGAALKVLFVFAHKGGTSLNYAEHSWAVATGPPGAGGLSLMITAQLFADEEEVRGRLMEFAGELYPHAVAFWYVEEELVASAQG